MESPLEVLSRAATMVQDNSNDFRLNTKELPTTKWRRERRTRAATEYSASSFAPSGIASTSGSGSGSRSASPRMNIHQQNLLRPLSESTNHSIINLTDTPIDMSMASTANRPRSPPPPYREPLPGSNYATFLARPSVITQAPPKRGDSRDSQLLSNRENDNLSTDSISMCETVIDEHFRRSLGPDYVAIFGKKSPTPSIQSQSPVPLPISMTPSPISFYRSSSSTPKLAMSPRSALSPRAAVSPRTAVSPTKSALSPKSPSQITIPNVSPNYGHLLSELSYPNVNIQNNHQIPAKKNFKTKKLAQTATPSTSTSTSTSSPPLPLPAAVGAVAPPMLSPTSSSSSFTATEPSVDDHFAKALGDTWTILQAHKKSKN